MLLRAANQRGFQDCGTAGIEALARPRACPIAALRVARHACDEARCMGSVAACVPVRAADLCGATATIPLAGRGQGHRVVGTTKYSEQNHNLKEKNSN